LWSDGTTYQGAQGVEVRLTASSYVDALEHDEHGSRLLRVEPRLELGDPLDQ